MKRPVVGDRLAIPFIDLAAQRRRLGDDLDRAIAAVLEHGRFILGPEVADLEERLSRLTEARHVVTCGNGTDALVLALMALGIGDGDAVLVPDFTFSATAESVVLAGATPVFVDVFEETFNLDPAGIDEGVAAARAAGLRPRAVIPVDLFGQPADYDAIATACGEHDLSIIADAAQSFGGAYRDRRVGTLGAVTTTSFFPSKPLSCYGDGGAVLTDDDDMGALLRSLRVHGQGSNKYDNVRIGMNSRLDSLQAAILIQKLSIFEDELRVRREIAARYDAGLAEVAAIPASIDGTTPVWALYTVRIPAGRRDAVQRALSEEGIPSVVYYPAPLHRQPAYTTYPRAGALATAERLSDEVLSLPMHPYLEPSVQEIVIASVRRALA